MRLTMLFSHRNQDRNQADIEERLLPAITPGPAKSFSPTKNSPGRCYLLVNLLNMIIFGSSIIVLTFGWNRNSPHSDGVNEILRRISTPSPIFDHVEFHLQPTMLNGSVLRTQDTPWNSGPEVGEKEALWNNLQHIRAIPLTSDQLSQMGKDPSKCAKLEDSFFHMGKDLYIGGLDIFHQARKSSI